MSKTVLDPSCGRGEFLVNITKRMLAAGNTDVLSNIYAADTSRLNLLVTKKRLEHIAKLHGNQSVIEFTNMINYNNVNELIASIGEMKFDVIIGNPPYQEIDDSGGALWNKITGIAFTSLVKVNGYVSMIHPPSFIGKHSEKGKGKNDYSYFKDSQVEQIHILDDHEKNKYFPGIGTKVCWYVAKKQAPTSLTKIIGHDKSQVYEYLSNFNNLKMLPSVINEISMRIHDKLISCESLVFSQKRELHYHSMKKKDTISDIQDKHYQYKSYFSHKIIRYSSFKFSDYSPIKVMVPQTSTLDNAIIDQDCNVSEDMFYVICDDMETALRLRDHLKSPLVNYIGRCYRSGRNLGNLLIAGIIPRVGSNFILDQDELDYINTFQ
jgi:hypothetical protein